MASSSPASSTPSSAGAEAPLRIDDVEAFAWDEVADVVIAGFGASGASAAIESRDRGSEVVVLDRFDGGGASALSGGIYYGGGTRYQSQAGYEDDAEKMRRYLELEIGDAVSPELLADFCSNSTANMDWLEENGVRFDSTLTEEKTAYPGQGYNLYFSGNERLPEFAGTVPPAPRGHRAVGNPEQPSGAALTRPLIKSALGKGVRFHPHTTIERLIVDRGGRVVGVEARSLEGMDSALEAHKALYAKDLPTRVLRGSRTRIRHEARQLEAGGRVVRVRALNRVILATGGFGANQDWLERYGPVDLGKTIPLTRMGCDGSGIALGQSVGGAVAKMDRFYVGTKLNPPDDLVRGIAVSPRGERFRNEESYTGTFGNDLVEKFEGKAWLVIDWKIYRAAIRQCVSDRSGRFLNFFLPMLVSLMASSKFAWSIRGLAKRTGMDPDTLAEAVRTYNTSLATGDPMGKGRAYTAPLRTKPFVAIDISVTNRFSFTVIFSLGGLVVDEWTGAVKRTDGSTIPGLFAAGRAAVGLPSHSYVSGLSIADCIYSGRRAARP